MLQSPNFVKYMATQGLTAPTYAYANNNPLRYVDSNGLYFRNVGDSAWTDLAFLLSNPDLAPEIQRMAADPVHAFDVYRLTPQQLDERTRKRGGARCNTTPATPTEHVVRYSPDYYRYLHPPGIADRPLTSSQLLAHELGEAWAQAYGQASDGHTIGLEFERAVP